MNRRIENLLSGLMAAGAQGAMLHSPENIRYFTGFTGEGCAFIASGVSVVMTDSRYTEQARKQSPGCTVLEPENRDYPQTFSQLAREYGISVLGFEDEFLPVAQHSQFAKALDTAQLIPMGELCVRIRAVKDADEIKLLREACRITDQAFQHFLTILKPGASEIEISAELKYYMAKHHKAAKSFEFIVASGENGSMPHAITSDRLIRAGDMVTLDFGAEYCGYHADMTRTVAVGKPQNEMLEIYRIVQDAQARAAEALAPGKSCREVDAIARDLIHQHGYGGNFGHGLGHGVGLQIHEQPVLSGRSSTILEPGMAVTVEPGIYLPGIGGVRIEDTCIITDTGWESLFVSEKSLIIL